MAKETDSRLGALQSDIQNDALRPLYIFHGEETYLRDRAMERIRALLLPAGLEDFNHERLAGRTMTVNLLRDAVESVPVMCQKRLVTVHDYDLYKADESARKQLAELFVTLPDSVCLVFIYDDLAYKPDKRVKLHDALEKFALTVRFDKQAGHELTRFLRAQFKSYGKTIENNDLDYLIHRCGELMGPLTGEVGKIALFAKTERITRGDIDAVATPVLSAVVFDLTKALSEQKNDVAMQVLAELAMQQQEPIMILGAIGKNLRELYAARLCLERGLGEPELMALTGCREYPARLHLRAARRFSLAWCRHAVIACAEADLQLKGGARDRSRVLEWLLASLAYEGRETA